jgi:selenium-binding protein 1
MTRWTPDPTFYPSPRLAAKAPAETVAFVAAFDPERKVPDSLAVVDVDPKSKSYSKIVGKLDLTHPGDELHHFGWNACSSCLCPNAPHPHVERRYLIVPGLRSSRIYVIDTKPDPRNPKFHKIIEPEELIETTGFSRPHTVHCGPDGIYVSALGNATGDGPGGVFLMDHETFEVLGRWEVERGPQRFAYDMWWHLGYDTVVTSEWGTPNTVENGLVPEILLGANYGRRLHFWDLHKRKHLQEIDFGPEYQPADPDLLPPLLKGFKAVPPLVTDIDLSVDDRFLYVSGWGTGDLLQYDVSDPFAPKLVGKVRIGGIVSRATHPVANGHLNGGPQMVEISRDGKRVYFTNSLYGAVDPQFYPEGIDGWMVKLRLLCQFTAPRQDLLLRKQ